MIVSSDPKDLKETWSHVMLQRVRVHRAPT